MEVVLAIALTVVVVYLLTTAIELFVVGVDASRTRVESAQLARALLDQIADDLASARLYAAPSTTAASGASGGTTGGGSGQAGGGDGGVGGQGGGGGGFGGAAGGGQASGGNAGNSAGGFGGEGSPGGGVQGSNGASGGTRAPLTPATAEGVYGTADLVRIDRGPLANWQRASRQVDVQETASAADMPVSVRYYFLDSQRMTPEKLAERGVSANDQDVSVSGLYRESQPFAALAPENSTTTDVAGPSKNAKVELLAPEVVGFELHYYDGEQLVDEWDTLQAGGLPLGVEIRLTLVELQFQTEPNADREAQRREGRYNKNELVEYRRFVRLPRVDPSPPAQPLLPSASGNQDGNQSRPGQNGGQQGGQPGQPGQPGSGNSQPQNNQ